MWDPPPEVGCPGGGEFGEVGRHLVGLLTSLGGLRPEHRVLDVGCSNGRVAAPLTRFLAAPGRYEGLDISRASIRWCRAAIGRRHGNFRFTFVNVRNGQYNPRGRVAPEDFSFPFPARAFDFVFLTSVFTHMLPAEIRRYLAEIARVLSPGGRIFATFFIVPASKDAPAQGDLRIDHAGPGYRTSNPEIPEEAIAYEEAVLRDWFRAAGFEIVEPIHRGSWSRLQDGVSFQDLVVATRRAQD